MTVQVVGGQVHVPLAHPPRVELLVDGLDFSSPQVFENVGRSGWSVHVLDETFCFCRDEDGDPVDVGLFNAAGAWGDVLAPVTVSEQGGMWQELLAPVTWLNSVLEEFAPLRRGCDGRRGLWFFTASNDAAMRHRIEFDLTFVPEERGAPEELGVREIAPLVIEEDQ